MNEKCCQQPDICPKGKKCKPHNSLDKPWRRFSCECRDGYGGEICKTPIRSCGGYLKSHPKSGKYKVLDSNNNTHTVYCHFDSDGAWTLVQSFSFANRDWTIYKRKLTEDHPISENAPTWNGYRLGKARMQSIDVYSDEIRFTCDSEKVTDAYETDYLQVEVEGSLTKITGLNLENNKYHGKIKGTGLEGCAIEIEQQGNENFQIKLEKKVPAAENACPIAQLPENCTKHYFIYRFKCKQPTHRCNMNQNSTSQIWFGKKKTLP